MSEFARALLGLSAAVAPLGALPSFLEAGVAPAARGRVIAVMCLAAFGLLTAAALLAGPLLEWLDVSPENFQLASGTIMLPQALHLIWRGRTLSGAEAGAIVPLGAPLLAGPASAAAAMSYGTRFGEAETIAAAALVLLGAAALLVLAGRAGGRLRPVLLETFARFNGALLALVAVEMIVDGVRSV